MDLATYDVTDHPTIRPGDWLELMGDALPPDTIAEHAGTNGYEILTSLGPRYARAYTA
jgi:alanine racemase